MGTLKSAGRFQAIRAIFHKEWRAQVPECINSAKHFERNLITWQTTKISADSFLDAYELEALKI